MELESLCLDIGDDAAELSISKSVCKFEIYLHELTVISIFQVSHFFLRSYGYFVPFMAQVAETHFTHGYFQKFALATFKHFW